MATQGNRKARAAVVGATGVAGQQFLAALATHPQIEVTHVVASARSAGKSYRDAIRKPSGLVAWYADGALDSRIAALEVEEADAFDASQVDVVFSCMDAAPARELEPVYAQHAAVISTASAYRMEDDVPLLLPGVNMDHLALLERQQARGWKGFIAPNPNCTTVGLAMTLAPLHRAFGIARVHMVSMQAVSGAGRSPGVGALDILDNIVPFIPKEEDKVATETQKILGTVQGDKVVQARFPVSCTCTRVPRDRGPHRGGPRAAVQARHRGPGGGGMARAGRPTSSPAGITARRRRSSTCTTTHSVPRCGSTATWATA